MGEYALIVRCFFAQGQILGPHIFRYGFLPCFCPPPPLGTFLVLKDFFNPFSGLQIEGGEGVSPIKYSIAKGRGGESGEMISILHRDVPASYYRVP